MVWLRDLVAQAVNDAFDRHTFQQVDAPEYLNVHQASELTGFAPQTLYQKHSAGLLPFAFKIGGRLMFSRDGIREWILKQMEDSK